MAKENWFKRHPVWSVIIGIFVLLVIIGILSSNGSDNNTQTEQKPTLTTQQILDVRQNYEVIVNNWVSTDWESHYNPNTDKTMSSFWTKLDLSVKNNNPDASLDWLTIRVNIKHPTGSDGKDISWGRLPIDVGNIKPGESKTRIVYYPGDLSQVTVMQDVYTTIENDISEENYNFFKELK